MGLRRVQQREARPRAGTERHLWVVACGGGHVDDVVGNGRLAVDVTDRGDSRAQARRVGDRLELVESIDTARAQKELAFRGPRRVTEPHDHGEPVALAVGKRERSCVLERVLGGDEEERRWQRAGLAVDGDLPLLHRLEQRRLRARCRTVDLVDEHDVGKERSRPELPDCGLGVEDRHAREIGGQQVGRGLDPPEARADGAGECLRQQGLAHAGNVLHEQVAAGEERDHGEAQSVVLAAYDQRQVVEEGARQVGDGGGLVRGRSAEDGDEGSRGQRLCSGYGPTPRGLEAYPRFSWRAT